MATTTANDLDDSFAAATAIIEADRAAIRADERAKIVAWLRDSRLLSRAFLADAIERGEHTGGGDDK